MNPDVREVRALSFASVAESYERSRPGYPDDAVSWLAGTDPLDVVDLGAGTGKLTRSLVALGHRVTAVEPLPEMLAHLRDAVPEVTAVEGGAEAIPLPDASADIVTVAQAFHWFDHGPALDEIARVLRPGGRVALIWNVRDEGEEWVTELSDAMVGRTGVDTGAADPIEASELFGAGRAGDLRPPCPGGRPGDVEGARAVPELLRRPLRRGARTGVRARERALRPARAGRRRPPPVPRDVLPR